jgi:prevent-host-death family protein
MRNRPHAEHVSSARGGLIRTIEWCVFVQADDAHRGAGMRVSVTETNGQLTKLVRRAEVGEEVNLTRHGHPAVRLVPVRAALDRKARRALLEAERASGAAKATAWPSAARSQDFLYGDDGLPEPAGWKVMAGQRAMAPRAGLEPATQRLTAACSTN